jgi:glutamate racemase
LPLSLKPISAARRDDELRSEIAPCFRDDGRRTDTVVLACTHYPLLLERLRKLSPWPVNFFDPAPAIARRVVNLLGSEPAADGRGTTHAIFTSGHAPEKALRRFGIGSNETATSAAR